MRHAWVAAPCLLSMLIGCSGGSRSSFTYRVEEGSATSFRQEGNRLEIEEREGAMERRAVLEVEKQESSGTVHLWRLLVLEPLESTEVGWIFRHLPPSSDVRLSDGRIVEHPDRAVAEELRKGLAADPPDVNALIQGMSRLRRFESRGRLLCEAAESESLPAATLDALIDAVAKDGASALRVPGPDGKPANGAECEFLYGVLLSLVNRKDIDQARAVRLAAGCPDIGEDSRESLVLIALVGKATTGAVLKAAENISSCESRYQVLKTLAGKGADGDQIAYGCPGIGEDSRESLVLIALVGKATTGAVLEAAENISSCESRYQVLKALAERGADGDPIARGCPGIGEDSRESLVLIALVGKATTGAVLEAAENISSCESRYQVLKSLAEKGADGDQVAQGCPGIGEDSRESLVLIALVGKASTKAVLEGAEKINSCESRYQVLKALAGSKDLTREDANRVVLACPGIGEDSREAAVLASLVGRADREAILRAVESVNSSSSRQSVLDALERK